MHHRFGLATGIYGSGIPPFARLTHTSGCGEVHPLFPLLDKKYKKPETTCLILQFLYRFYRRAINGRSEDRKFRRGVAPLIRT